MKYQKTPQEIRGFGSADYCAVSDKNPRADLPTPLINIHRKYGIPRALLYRAAHTGALPCMRSGRTYLTTWTWVQRWMEKESGAAGLR